MLALQVYRGKMRPEWGGTEVAVKVQRPGALENAALDIFVMRRAAVLFSMLPGMSDKWAGALDDWADRFFQVCGLKDVCVSSLGCAKQGCAASHGLGSSRLVAERLSSHPHMGRPSQDRLAQQLTYTATTQCQA